MKVGNVFRIAKQFSDNFALVGPDGLTWHTGHSAQHALKTQQGELQRAFDLGRQYERQQGGKTNGSDEAMEPRSKAD